MGGAIWQRERERETVLLCVLSGVQQQQQKQQQRDARRRRRRRKDHVTHKARLLPLTHTQTEREREQRTSRVVSRLSSSSSSSSSWPREKQAGSFSPAPSAKLISRVIYHGSLLFFEFYYLAASKSLISLSSTPTTTT